MSDISAPSLASGSDAANGVGTSGERLGTSWLGLPAAGRLLPAWRWIVLLMAAATTINALTAHADHPHAAAWEPLTWEASSGLTMLLVAWLPGLALLVAPLSSLRRRGGLIRFAGVHAATFLVFSAVHVAGMLALRQAVYALVLGSAYRIGPLAERFFYEARKDLLTYLIFAAFYEVASRRRPTAVPVPTPLPARDEAVIDIRDGARLIRVPAADVLAVTSAGNYVEFRLADGRRPLMRATLSAVEREFASLGLVRTHRSWLVNAARMQGLRPEGSGDWTVELGAVEAPLSRRYPAALSRLRGG